MFSLSDQELQDLIDKYNGKYISKERTPEYDLKTVVECGLMFLYGKMHLKNGKIVQCGEKFNLYKKHKCKTEDKGIAQYYKTSFLEIGEIKALEKTQNTLKTCWTGYNLAVLTADFTLQGYFKKDLLFQKKFPPASAIVAGADKICIGLFSGEIIYFDPITQNEISRPCHTDTITSLSYENNNLLSSSLDGSIFYRKKINMSDSGILDVQYISDEKFICSCTDNKIMLYNSGEISTFVGHTSRIKALSYNRFGISSSKNGEVGFLFKESIFELEKLNASLHKRFSINQFFGHGLSEVFMYDVNQRQKTWVANDTSLNLAVKDNLLAYSVGRTIKISDIRSKDIMMFPLNTNITDLSFSDSGDMLLVCTDQTPLIVDFKHI